MDSSVNKTPVHPECVDAVLARLGWDPELNRDEAEALVRTVLDAWPADRSDPRTEGEWPAAYFGPLEPIE